MISARWAVGEDAAGQAAEDQAEEKRGHSRHRRRDYSSSGKYGRGSSFVPFEQPCKEAPADRHDQAAEDTDEEERHQGTYAPRPL
jgi:hypothetical protein